MIYPRRSHVWRMPYSLPDWENFLNGKLNKYGILAQLVEHLTFNQVVGGSNPPCLISLINANTDFIGVRVFLPEDDLRR